MAYDAGNHSQRPSSPPVLSAIAGSLNFKDKWAPDFPAVQIAHNAPGLMGSTGQLESMGLIAEPEKPAPPISRLSRTDRVRSNKALRWEY